jgi:hypothetical protein
VVKWFKVHGGKTKWTQDQDFIRSDSGGEHVSNEFVALCDQEGMVCDMVHPTTSPIAERMNITIMDMVISMLKNYWRSCVHYHLCLKHMSKQRD